MGTLAHILEAEGLSTVVLSLTRGNTERLKPPRALHCEFPMGRPLGKPKEPEFQRKVLDQAFSLFSEEEGPVLVDFPEVIKDETDQPLSCTIPPRMDESLPVEVDEVKGLRPAYDRAVTASGRTNVGRLVDADGIVALVESFIQLRDGTEWTEAGVPDNNIMEASKDIMSYYEEAAVELADHVPGARAAESWFFKHTATGQLLKDARDALHKSKVPIWFYVIPFTQQM